MTKASQELHLSQPALSRQLKALEREYGARFHLKTNRGVNLTEQGRAFLEVIHPIAAQVDLVERTFKTNLNVTERSSLVIGGSGLSVIVLPELLMAFKQAHSVRSLTVITHNSARTERGILSEETEIALITNPSYSPRIAYKSYQSHNLVAFVCSEKPFGQSRMTLAELAKNPLVVRRHCRSLKQFSKRGYQPNIVLRCETNEAVKAAVRKGLGVGILLRESVDQNLTTIDVPELKKVKIKSFIIYDKNKSLGPLADAFLRFLLDSRARN